jgi:hypothetical protein
MVTARAVGRKPARGSLDRLEVAFDDEHAVADAGLLLTATLAERLGIEALADQMITLGARPGAARPGRRVMTLVHSMVAGGDAIDDADVLRTGATAQLLGHRVMALSTLGTFLRSFTFGHVRQLDRLTEAVLARAWAAGAGPGEGPMTIDLDSTICEVHGPAKGGASYGTRASSATTRSWPRGPRPAKCCTAAFAAGGPTAPAGRCASARSWPGGCAGPGPRAR